MTASHTRSIFTLNPKSILWQVQVVNRFGCASDLWVFCYHQSLIGHLGKASTFLPACLGKIVHVTTKIMENMARWNWNRDWIILEVHSIDYRSPHQFHLSEVMTPSSRTAYKASRILGAESSKGRCWRRMMRRLGFQQKPFRRCYSYYKNLNLHLRKIMHENNLKS